MSQRDDRSLENMRSDVEHARAGLTDTVDELRSRVVETAEELRQRMSPGAIGAEVSDYFQKRGDRLVDLARQNPLEAAAIGALAAYPLLRVARSIPVPLLMVGAGFFLLSNTGRDASRKVAAMASDNIQEGANAVRDKIREAQDYGADRLNAASASIAASTEAVRQKVSAAGDSLSDAAGTAIRAASDAGTAVGQTAQRASDAATAPETFAAVQRRTSDAMDRASTVVRRAIEDNPLLIGGIGMALGALVASALPSSDLEKGLLGEASADVRKRAMNAASQGVQQARSAANDIYGDVSERLEQEGLSADTLKEAAQGLGERVRKGAEAAATSAFDSARKPH